MLIISLLLTESNATAIVRWKGPAEGYWHTLPNWAGGIPDSNSVVRLDHDLQTNAYTVIVNDASFADKLWMDSFGTQPVNLRITPSGSLQLSSLRMGDKEYDRNAEILIDGGSLIGLAQTEATDTNSSFLVGNNPGGTASLCLTNAARVELNGQHGLTVASSAESSGQIHIYDSSVQISESLIVAKGPDSFGQMLISGTSEISIGGELHIAKLDNGVLWPHGTLYMAGGTLSCETLNIGSHGSGHLIITNGIVRAASGGITIGLSESNGELSIRNGLLQATNSFLHVGHTDSTGLLTINGGIVNIDGPLRVGSGSRGTGTLTMNNGTLTVDQLTAGEALSANAELNLLGGELKLCSKDLSGLMISNGVMNLQQTLIHWACTDISEWTTHTIQNNSISWSNGFPHGTFSTNGFDGSVGGENGTLYWDNSDNGSQFHITTIWTERPPYSPFELWTQSYGLKDAETLWSADPDQDSLNNLTEFGLGGNPTNALDAPELKPIAQPGTMNYIHRERVPPSAYGLNYYMESCEDLIQADWRTNSLETAGTHLIDSVNVITSTIPEQAFTNLFLRLRIELN